MDYDYFNLGWRPANKDELSKLFCGQTFTIDPTVKPDYKKALGAALEREANEAAAVARLTKENAALKTQVEQLHAEAKRDHDVKKKTYDHLTASYDKLLEDYVTLQNINVGMALDMTTLEDDIEQLQWRIEDMTAESAEGSEIVDELRDELEEAKEIAVNVWNVTSDVLMKNTQFLQDQIEQKDTKIKQQDAKIVEHQRLKEKLELFWEEYYGEGKSIVNIMTAAAAYSLLKEVLEK